MINICMEKSFQISCLKIVHFFKSAPAQRTSAQRKEKETKLPTS